MRYKMINIYKIYTKQAGVFAPPERLLVGSYPKSILTFEQATAIVTNWKNNPEPNYKYEVEEV